MCSPVNRWLRPTRLTSMKCDVSTPASLHHQHFPTKPLCRFLIEPEATLSTSIGVGVEMRDLKLDPLVPKSQERTFKRQPV